VRSSRYCLDYGKMRQRNIVTRFASYRACFVSYADIVVRVKRARKVSSCAYSIIYVPAVSIVEILDRKDLSRNWAIPSVPATRRAQTKGCQAMRAAGRKALKPQPTHQAKLVAWHLTYRVPLHFAALPETEIVQACERFNLPLETWRRQERAFGLLRKVYAKRAAIRGQQQPPTVPAWAQQFQDWPTSDSVGDEAI
jgi:hypothetical protein